MKSVEFLCSRHITDIRFSKFVIEIADEFLDIISDSLESLPSEIGLLYST